jgi:hypothetical protein
MAEYIGDHNYVYFPSIENQQKIKYWKVPLKDIEE